MWWYLKFEAISEEIFQKKKHPLDDTNDTLIEPEVRARFDTGYSYGNLARASISEAYCFRTFEPW